uniref:ARAD1D19998p n=1 Tax=Blastobotrys adeninivorans TaxID=409370 RepID=A0A060T9N8_BLAAD
MEGYIECYRYAEQARTKLTKEASRPELDLRRLACLANHFDRLTATLDKKRKSLIPSTKPKPSPMRAPAIVTISETEIDQDIEDHHDMLGSGTVNCTVDLHHDNSGVQVASMEVDSDTDSSSDDDDMNPSDDDEF